MSHNAPGREPLPLADYKMGKAESLWMPFCRPRASSRLLEIIDALTGCLLFLQKKKKITEPIWKICIILILIFYDYKKDESSIFFPLLLFGSLTNGIFSYKIAPNADYANRNLPRLKIISRRRRRRRRASYRSPTSAATSPPHLHPGNHDDVAMAAEIRRGACVRRN